MEIRDYVQQATAMLDALESHSDQVWIDVLVMTITVNINIIVMQRHVTGGCDNSAQLLTA